MDAKILFWGFIGASFLSMSGRTVTETTNSYAIGMLAELTAVTLLAMQAEEAEHAKAEAHQLVGILPESKAPTTVAPAQTLKAVRSEIQTIAEQKHEMADDQKIVAKLEIKQAAEIPEEFEQTPPEFEDVTIEEDESIFDGDVESEIQPNDEEPTFQELGAEQRHKGVVRPGVVVTV